MAPGVVVEASHPLRPEARDLLEALSRQLESLTGSDGRAGFADWRDEPGHVFLIARIDGRAVGCGALRPLEPGVGEVKRMFASRSGVGVGAAVLAGLEAAGRAQGLSALRVRTRQVNERAVRFYQRQGFQVSGVDGLSVWLQKQLGSPRSDGRGASGIPTQSTAPRRR